MSNPLPMKGFCSLVLRPAPGEASPAPAGRAGSPVTVCTCGPAPPRPAPPRAVSHGSSRAPQRHPACVYTATLRGETQASKISRHIFQLWWDCEMTQKWYKSVQKCEIKFTSVAIRYCEQIHTYVNSCGLLTWIMSRMFVMSVDIWLYGFMLYDSDTSETIISTLIVVSVKMWLNDRAPAGDVSQQSQAVSTRVPTATPPEAHITSSSSIITGAAPITCQVPRPGQHTTVALCYRCRYI